MKVYVLQQEETTQYKKQVESRLDYMKLTSEHKLSQDTCEEAR